MGTVKEILSKLEHCSDDIYSYSFISSGQDDEIRLRKRSASERSANLLEKVSKHHSISVMDREVRLFLKKIPQDGLIIDAGGCLGWHWRNLNNIRPDVTVLNIDFIRENLCRAKYIIGSQLNNNIFLVHGNATSLIFEDNTFDGYWSVQALQHIPNFKKAIYEAYRVLKRGGIFANYSWNNQLLIRLIYGLIGKKYHIEGEIPGSYYLARASNKQRRLISEVFSNTVERRFTEIIFPLINSSGKEKSLIGKIDSMLSSNNFLFSIIANQQSYHTVK